MNWYCNLDIYWDQNSFVICSNRKRNGHVLLLRALEINDKLKFRNLFHYADHTASTVRKQSLYVKHEYASDSADLFN